ncbi:MAG TPA: aspartyl protease family protein [Burkholderiales bacterium]
MKTTFTLVAAAAVGFTLAGPVLGAGSQQCKLIKIDEWPLNPRESRPAIDGFINGQKIGVLLDTGMSGALLVRGTALRLGLTRQQLRGSGVLGIGGESHSELAFIDELKISRSVRKNWQVETAGFGPNEDAGGGLLIGFEFFKDLELEFDLPQNMLRLFQAKDCDGVSLAYWAPGAASEVPVDVRGHLLVTVEINGKRITAVLDSGASHSFVTSGEAARVGVTPESPGVIAGGCVLGFGRKGVDSWIGQFETFVIGNEVIRNPKIHFADLWEYTTYTVGRMPRRSNIADMILGADFLRAHRVLISQRQGKMYFTHTGGTVFPTQPGKPCKDLLPALAQWTPDVAQCAKGGEPADARIAACTRAIASGKLSSKNLGFTYNNRGNAWGTKGQYDKAIADFDEAIRLNPQDAPTYGNRGHAWYRKNDYDRAIADYGEAIRHNPLRADYHLVRGYTQFWLGRFAASLPDLTESLRLKPNQSYAIIWRYLAQSRSGEPELAKSELSEKLGPLDKAKWPAPVIDFLLGKSDPEALLKAAEHPDAETRRGQVCEAEFYVGEWHLLNLRHKEAGELLGRAEKNCPKAFVEYDGAVAELRRMAK